MKTTFFSPVFSQLVRNFKYLFFRQKNQEIKSPAKRAPDVELCVVSKKHTPRSILHQNFFFAILSLFSIFNHFYMFLGNVKMSRNGFRNQELPKKERLSALLRNFFPKIVFFFSVLKSERSILWIMKRTRGRKRSEMQVGELIRFFDGNL